MARRPSGSVSARLTSGNAEGIIRDYDLVVDACDNMPTRYLMNSICQAERKPFVHGSIFQFEGRATVFLPDEGPCYKCLYPVPPSADISMILPLMASISVAETRFNGLATLAVLLNSTMPKRSSSLK